MKEKETSLDEDFQELIKLKAVTKKDGFYTYSSELVKTVEQIKRKPPGKFRQLRMAHKLARRMASLLVATAKTYRSRRDVENLVTSYVVLDLHLKRLGLKVDEKRKPWLAYALWLLNDNKISVEVEG